MTTYLPEIASRFISSSATTLTRTLRVYDSDGAAYLTLAGTLTYTLEDDAGTDVYGPETPSGTGTSTLTVSDATPPTRTPGKRLRETWGGLTAGGVAMGDVVIDVYVVRGSMEPPFTHAAIVAAYPDILASYPASQTSWWTQILQARDEVLARIVLEGWPGDLWDVFALRNPMYHLAVSKCLWCAAGTGAGGMAELAALHEARYQQAWPRLRPGVDADGDGDRDGTAKPSSPTGAPAPGM